MPNPYGITEVDVGGVLGAYQSAQDRRFQRLMAERQISREDRELEREAKRTEVIGNFIGRTSPRGGVQGAYSPPDTGAPQNAVDPYDPWNDEGAQAELINSLAAIDPQQAMQLRNQFRQSSADERKAVAESYKQLGNVAFSLRQVPPAQRGGELQRMAPMLEQLGITPQMIAGVDLSDQSLEMLVNQFRDIEKVIAGRTPDIVPVQAGGTVYTSTPASPYPDFGAQSAGPAEGSTATNPQTGEKIIFRGGAWQPAMSDQQGGNVLSAAQGSQTISQGEAARVRQSLGPNGQAKFDAWLRDNNVVVGGN